MSTQDTTPGWEHYTPRQWFTVTELAQFARCPRKYFLGSGCSLRSRDDKIALRFGEAIHAGAPIALVSGPEAGFREFKKVWDKYGLEMNGDPKRNERQAWAILEDLFLTQTSSASIYTVEKPPQIMTVAEEINDYEMPFVLDIGLPVPLVGRLDGLARMKATGQRWVLEYKTSSEMGTRFFSAFSINSQAIGYTVAARNILNDPSIQGCIVQGLFVGTSKRESPAMPIFVSDHEAETYLKFIRELGWRILEYEKRRDFPCWYSGCNQISQFGLPGYNCDFVDLCKVADWTPQRERFEVSPHIPFKELTLARKESPNG